MMDDDWLASQASPATRKLASTRLIANQNAHHVNNFLPKVNTTCSHHTPIFLTFATRFPLHQLTPGTIALRSHSLRDTRLPNIPPSWFYEPIAVGAGPSSPTMSTGVDWLQKQKKATLVEIAEHTNMSPYVHTDTIP